MTIVDWVGVVAVVIPAIFTGYKMFSMLKDMQRTLNRVEMDTIRLQLLQMIQHDPTNRVAINMLRDLYIGKNGNSYVLTEYEKWAKKYNKSKKQRK